MHILKAAQVSHIHRCDIVYLLVFVDFLLHDV